MQLPGVRGQAYRDFTYDASGTITTGGTAQLVLPERKATSSFSFQNISDTVMYLEIGSARAHAVLTSGVVTSIVVDNAGFGFTRPPRVHFLGGASVGWNMSDGNYLGAGQQGYPSPSNFARGHAVLSGNTLGSIVIDNPGSKYANAPYILITNDIDDPFGCATPSATSGFLIPPLGGNINNLFNSSVCTTDPISVFCATTGKAFTVKWTS